MIYPLFVASICQLVNHWLISCISDQRFTRMMFWTMFTPWEWSRQAQAIYYLCTIQSLFFVFLGFRADYLSHKYLDRGGKCGARLCFVYDVVETFLLAFVTAPMAIIMIFILCILSVSACFMASIYHWRQHQYTLEGGETEPLIIVCNPNDPDEE